MVLATVSERSKQLWVGVGSGKDAIIIRFDSTLTGDDYTTHTLTGKTLTVTAHGGGHFTGAL